MSEIEEVIATARESFNRGVTKSLEFRMKQLHSLLHLVEENSSTIEESIAKDCKKPRFEISLYEIEFIKNEIRHTLHNLEEWIKPKKAAKSLAFIMDKVFIYSEPYGVVLVVGTWNYPFMISLSPMVGAIAAGNCVIVKPSELAPSCAQILAKLLPQYLDPSCYQVVLGGIPETTKLLQQRFDYIFYTGAPAVGKIIQKAASTYLTPVTLELGGKSPAYVDDTADINLAVGRILWGKCINAGQSCIAPDYILCSKEVQAKFIQAASLKLKKWYGDDVRKSPDYGRIINANHFRRITNLLKGANIAVGGQSDVDELFIEPTILQDVNPADPIMQEEIFGPVLPILNVRNAEEAIAYINKNEKPLALYVFSNDTRIQDLFLKNTSSGNMLVNDTMLHFTCDTIPFGGVGNSGIGAYHGKFSFDTFSHAKGTVIKKLDKLGEHAISPRYPPYSDKHLNFINAFTRKRNYPQIPYFTHIIAFSLGILITFIIMFCLSGI